LQDISSRIVTGYQGGEINGYTDLHVVRQSDAHAWTEVWFEDRGWVRVDPVTAVLPERVSMGSLRGSLADQGAARFGGLGWLRNAAFMWDALQTYWSRTVVGFGAESQRSLLEKMGLDDLRFNERFFVLGALVFAAVLVLAVVLSL
jgi:transglutaminase-like putative cysteine protease